MGSCSGIDPSDATACVRVSGFNPCLQDAANPKLSGRLLLEPWWSWHRGTLQNALHAELSLMANVVALEIVCEPKTVLTRMRAALGPDWSTESWRRAFAAGDTNNDGTLDKQEMRRLIEHFEMQLTEKEFEDLWEMVDVGGEPSGAVDFWELVEAFRFDDWEEAAAKNNRSDVIRGKGKREKFRPARNATGDYPMFALVTVPSSSDAESLVNSLQNKRIQVHDKTGCTLSSTEAIARSMLPLGLHFLHLRTHTTHKDMYTIQRPCSCMPLSVYELMHAVFQVLLFRQEALLRRQKHMRRARTKRWKKHKTRGNCVVPRSC